MRLAALLMRYVIIDLAISRDEYMKYYRGQALQISTRARDGRIVRLPASVMRQFITLSGLHGSFAVYYDDHGRLQQIDRLS